MLVSSASDRQSTDLQRDAGLAKALSLTCPGDVLAVWKLDRLGRSLSHLLSIVTSLGRQVALRSLTEGMDTTRHRANCCFMFSAHLRSTSAL